MGKRCQHWYYYIIFSLSLPLPSSLSPSPSFPASLPSFWGWFWGWNPAPSSRKPSTTGQHPHAASPFSINSSVLSDCKAVAVIRRGVCALILELSLKIKAFYSLSFPILPFPFLSFPIKTVKESQWPCLRGLVLASQGVAKPLVRSWRLQAQAEIPGTSPRSMLGSIVLFCFCFCLETGFLRVGEHRRPVPKKVYFLWHLGCKVTWSNPGL